MSTSPLRTLLALGALQFVLSAAYITYFSFVFDFGSRLIVLHLCVLSMMMAGGAIALGATLRVSRSPIVRRALALVPAVAFVALIILYGANVVSTASWGHNVTFDLAMRYATRPAVLAGYLATVVSWPPIALAAGVGLGGAIVLAWTRAIIDGLPAIVDRTARAAHVRRALLLGGGLLPASAAAAVLTTLGPDARTQLVSREPIVGFVVDPASFHRVALSTFAARFREEGPAVRRAYAATAPFDRRNVILVVADSLRPDHLPAYGYLRPTTPFLERLRASGRLAVVKRAMATCPESNCGISSLLSSKAFGSQVPENFALHELLFDQGYEAYFILSGDHRWLGMRRFYGDDLTAYFDGTASARYEPTDDRAIFEGLERVPDFSGTPAFFYVHLMSPHAIGYQQQAYRQFHPSVAPGTIRGGEMDHQTLMNSYDNGVRQTDAVLEQLWDVLDRKGYLADALAIVTADHGEGLGERGGIRGHAFQGSLHQEFLSIPLLIYEEQRAEYGNLEFATQVDVAPTVVDRLGLPAPASWEGRSLLRAGPRTYSYHYMDTYDVPWYAVTHPTGGALYKYLRQSEREELFELGRDPEEQHNLMASADRALVARLRSQLDGVLASAGR